MSRANAYRFTRYLAAKKSVDDRSLNRYVWDTLVEQIAEQDGPFRILEVGAGTGTMIERIMEWRLIDGEINYTAIDAQSDNISEARRYLHNWATHHGVEVRTTPSGLSLKNERSTLNATLHTADAFAYVETQVKTPPFDLLIANAFIDLVNIPSALPKLFRALKPGGLFYFSLTFDGITAFEPVIDATLDSQIEALYHADMEKRRWNNKPTGGSQAGRRLLRFVGNSDLELLAAGASDWVVTPHRGDYRGDEAYFLHFIIHTIETALTGHPDLDAKQFKSWIIDRHNQVDNGILFYIAHQLDILGRI